jgi:hypothetical protein
MCLTPPFELDYRRTRENLEGAEENLEGVEENFGGAEENFGVEVN